jgi:hypothetical protein
MGERLRAIASGLLRNVKLPKGASGVKRGVHGFTPSEENSLTPEGVSYREKSTARSGCASNK